MIDLILHKFSVMSSAQSLVSYLTTIHVKDCRFNICYLLTEKNEGGERERERERGGEREREKRREEKEAY